MVRTSPVLIRLMLYLEAEILNGSGVTHQLIGCPRRVCRANATGELQSCVRTSTPGLTCAMPGPDGTPVDSLGSTVSTTSVPRKRLLARSITLNSMPRVTWSAEPTEIVAYSRP